MSKEIKVTFTTSEWDMIHSAIGNKIEACKRASRNAKIEALKAVWDDEARLHENLRTLVKS